jgi:hypothetical protein
MGQSTLGLPLNVVAGRSSDKEGLGAASVSVIIEAAFNCKVKYTAFGNGLF